MATCPHCQSERLVLLTFSQDVERLSHESIQRPFAKCVDCGRRLTAQDIRDQDKAFEPPV